VKICLKFLPVAKGLDDVILDNVWKVILLSMLIACAAKGVIITEMVRNVFLFISGFKHG